MYESDAKHSPKNSPTLYRRASLSDIEDSKILGFYAYDGLYLRKNGTPSYSGPFPVVNLFSTTSKLWTITGRNYPAYFVRLDEILSEENAPPKHFILTRITVEVVDPAGLAKFMYLLGARGYVGEAQPYDDRYTYEVVLEFQEPLLVPPTILLNMIDDCGAAQGWEWKVNTKR